MYLNFILFFSEVAPDVIDILLSQEEKAKAKKDFTVLKGGKYLFCLYSSRFACLECCLFQDQEVVVREKSIQAHNIKILKQIQNIAVLDVSQEY